MLENRKNNSQAVALSSGCNGLFALGLISQRTAGVGALGSVGSRYCLTGGEQICVVHVVVDAVAVIAKQAQE